LFLIVNYACDLPKIEYLEKDINHYDEFGTLPIKSQEEVESRQTLLSKGKDSCESYAENDDKKLFRLKEQFETALVEMNCETQIEQTKGLHKFLKARIDVAKRQDQMYIDKFIEANDTFCKLINHSNQLSKSSEAFKNVIKLQIVDYQKYISCSCRNK